MANPVQKIRKLFEAVNQPLTLTEIRKHLPDLKSSEISMAMWYLRRQRYVYKTLVRSAALGRTHVFQYHYSQTKLPEEFYE